MTDVRNDLTETSQCLCLASRRAARDHAEIRPRIAFARTEGDTVQICWPRAGAQKGPQSIGALAEFVGADRTTLTRNLAIAQDNVRLVQNPPGAGRPLAHCRHHAARPAAAQADLAGLARDPAETGHTQLASKLRTVHEATFPRPIHSYFVKGEAMMITVSAFTGFPILRKDRYATCACAGRWKKQAWPISTRLLEQAEKDKPEYRTWQPFGQVPAYEEDGLQLFESGAIVLHIGEKSEALFAKRIRLRAPAPRSGSSPRSTPAQSRSS